MAGITTPPESPRFDPQHGMAVPVAAAVVRVTARNTSPYTFTGTNSYLLGHDRLLLVDPGPDRDDHLAALVAAVGRRQVDAIVLTHTHRDHCGLARKAAAQFGSPIWSSGPHRLSRPLHRFEINPFAAAGDFTLVPDRLLGAGDPLETDAGDWSVLPTPGHCANHIALLGPDGVTALVGDHVMGWNSTLIAAPDGALAPYFASLEALIAQPYALYLPGHGAAIADGPTRARDLAAHRQMRNGQILKATRDGSRTLSEITRVIYPTLRGKQLIGARRTVLAHLEYLEAQGEFTLRRSLFGVRVA